MPHWSSRKWQLNPSCCSDLREVRVSTQDNLQGKRGGLFLKN